MQVEYSPFVLDIEHPDSSGESLLATCRELGCSVVAYSPLGRGLLTGAFMTRESLLGDGDTRTQYERFQGDNFDKNVELVRQFQALAKEQACSASQLAIAWLLKQGPHVIPIPGTKKLRYLEENWGSRNVMLNDEAEAKIRDFVTSIEVAGSRLQEARGECR